MAARRTVRSSATGEETFSGGLPGFCTRNGEYFIPRKPPPTWFCVSGLVPTVLPSEMKAGMSAFLAASASIAW